VENYSEQILANIRQIIRAIDLHSKSLVKRYGLTGPQLLVLKELNREQTQTIGTLSANISLSQATVTSILDRLERQGFVSRVRQTSDKRKVSITLSEKTQRILDSQPNLLQEEFIDNFESLANWEQTMLISSLQRSAAMMNAENIKSPPVLASGPLAASKSDVQNYLDEESR